MFNQLPEHPTTWSCWHIKLTIISRQSTDKAPEKKRWMSRGKQGHRRSSEEGLEPRRMNRTLFSLSHFPSQAGAQRRRKRRCGHPASATLTAGQWTGVRELEPSQCLVPYTDLAVHRGLDYFPSTFYISCKLSLPGNRKPWNPAFKCPSSLVNPLYSLIQDTTLHQILL